MKLGRVENFGYFHWCPGCKKHHTIAVDKPFSNGARWTFNGNLEAPSFQPSMHIKVGPYYHNNEDTGPTIIDICHYFLTDGQMHFLADCTHELKGQIVALTDIRRKETK